MGIGDSWGTREELLHPRDKNGRFRSKWKMASGVIDAILKALGSFNPKTFTSDGEAGQYLFNHAKPSRFRGGSDYKALSGFAQANKNLRAGSMDTETKNFVKVMDESSVNLPEDVILSKVVGPQAFGLTPETVGLDEGGIEDFTGKLIGDRGYNSAMIGTPGRKQPGQIEMRIAVPKGTKAVIPATSRGDREVILDKDQELRVTKVTPDGQGGFYVLAVAQPRTPGATPEPVGSPAPAPGAPQAPGVPGDVQSDNVPDPRAMVQQPGAPPPRSEPEVTPSIGGGPVPAGPGGQPTAPGPGVPDAPVPGAPGAPAVDAPVPETPRIVDLRTAVREANLPAPSRGENRAAFNEAYLGLVNGKKDPVDVLRELEADISNLEGRGRIRDRGGIRSEPPDPAMRQGDIAALKGLRDLIREQYNIPAPKAAPAKKEAAPAAPAPTKATIPPVPTAPKRRRSAGGTPTAAEREGNARIRRELRESGSRGGASPLSDAERERIRDQADIANRRQAARDEAGNAAIRQTMAPFLEQAGIKESDLGDFDKTGFMVVGGLLQRKRISRAEAARRLRTDRDSPLNKIADALESRARKAAPTKKAAPAKAAPVKKAAPEAPAAPGDDLDKMLKSELLTEAGRRNVEVRPSWTKDRIKQAIRGEAPAPAKKAAPTPVAKAAKAAVPGAAPGTAAGKITATRLQPGTQMLVTEREGAWLPTNRKTGSVSVEVTAVERVQGGTTPGGRGTSRARIRITARDADGNEKQINASPSQTFLVQPATAATLAPERAAPVAAFPKDEGAAVNMRRPLRRGERNEMADIIDRLVADGNTIPGFTESLGGRGSVKQNLEDLSEELRSSKKLTAFDVSLITDSVFQRLGLGRTQGVFNDKERRDTELRDFLAERLPAIKNVVTGENTPAAKAARTKVDGPKATTTVLAPDRKKNLRDAVTDLELNFQTGSAKRQVDEIVDDMEAGKLTPEEGIRRLETEIALNKEELADLDRAVREESSQELKRLGVEKRRKLAGSIKEQERASAGLRKHFGKEPAVTTDEVVINLPAESQEALNDATLAELKKAAEGLGIKATGRTKKQFLDAVIKKLAENEMERRGITKVPAPAKAPSKPKPTPAGAKYERIDLRALAEGLPIDTEQDKRIFDRFQKQLDDEKQTPPKIADEIIGTARQAFFWPAVVNQQVSHKDIRPGMSETEIADINARNVEVRAETDRFKAKGQAWLDLAERLRKVRRKKAGSVPPDAPEPKLSAPEKAEIKQVAELTDIPAETLAKKALAKKKADAPPPRTAQQVADTLATVNSADEANAILKGHTKAELLDIAKVMDVEVRPSATKAKIIEALSVKAPAAAPAAPSGGALTRAQLQEMTVPEIKALEDELEIQRPSLNRDDRIDAILRAQGDAPAPKKATTPVDPLEAAQKRQADIDQARKYGNIAGEFDQILSAGASPEAMAARLQAAGEREGVDVTQELAAVRAGDIRQAKLLITGLLDQRGIRQTGGSAGQKTNFDPKTQQLLPGMKAEDGRVEIIRPAFELNRNGERIIISKAVVEPIDKTEAPAPDVDRPKKGLQAGATKATEIKVPAGFEAWFRDGRKKNIVIYDKDRNPVAIVSPISVKVDAEEGGGQEDVQERFYGSLWGQPNTNTGSIRSQADAVKAALDMMKRDQPSKLSTKPILENTWGGRRSEIHFHADGAIGMGLRGLKEDDRRLEVNGDALENVIGRIATDLVTGEITGDEQIDRLRNVAAGLPDGPAKRTVSRMVADLEAPRREAIKVPDAGQYTGVLQELMNKLLQIPLARGGSRVNRQGFNEVDLLLDYIRGLRPNRPVSLLAADLRRALWNKRHESMEGKLAIDRAVLAAVDAMHTMRRKPS